MKWLRDRFKYAFAGLKACMQDKSIRMQIVLGVFVLLAGFFFRLSISEWMWILLCICLVITSEVFNSCIEKTVDYISLDIDPRAKQIKDMAASAVLFICIFSILIGLIIFIPKIL